MIPQQFTGFQAGKIDDAIIPGLFIVYGSYSVPTGNISC